MKESEGPPDKIACKCRCDTFFLFDRIFANGTKHVQAYCSQCGRHKQFIAQLDPREVELDQEMYWAMQRDSH